MLHSELQVSISNALLAKRTRKVLPGSNELESSAQPRVFPKSIKIRFSRTLKIDELLIYPPLKFYPSINKMFVR